MIESDRIKRRPLVLIVDDQEINRDALGITLEDEYDVIYACNGKEALDLMHEHETDLSIVLLDLMMPVMSGFEVLEHVQRDERLKAIPIIVLTAEKSAELEALQMGAADFITKPFDMPEIILARLDRIIELSEGRQLISAAEYDRITGLYSRSFFPEYANRLFKYHPELHMDAVVMDIDQFHSVNDLNGREFGDQVLRSIGEEIRAFLADTQGIACRFEADLFNVYCIHQDDYGTLLKRVQAKANSHSSNAAIHLRMGVMPWQEGVEPMVLFDRAKAACNMARANYQNALIVYDDDMRQRKLLNQRLINDLRTAVKERQFKVFYQPKYGIQGERPELVSAEALIRWEHPELGLVSPGDFIPLFEESGIISIVDRFVWQEAARQVAEWREALGFTLPVSVNLSRTDLFDPTLEDRLVQLIKDNELERQDIKLEVTESAYTNNAKEMLKVIGRLQSLGFEIEMDDFGSGYSSLNMLSEMPIDVLKMDMKFIRHIEENKTDMRLVELILDIARYLKLTVVAEGVETKGQLALLRDAGCDLVQGFYFSRPVPARDFEQLIGGNWETERM